MNEALSGVKKSGGMGSHGLPTEFGEDDEVLGVALRAGHARRAVATLLLVHPALQARLVHPLGGATAAARPDPLGRPVILVCGKAHPAAPGEKIKTPLDSGMGLEMTVSATKFVDQIIAQFSYFITSTLRKILFNWLHLTTLVYLPF